jgi:hypothetical protein
MSAEWAPPDEQAYGLATDEMVGGVVASRPDPPIQLVRRERIVAILLRATAPHEAFASSPASNALLRCDRRHQRTSVDTTRFRQLVAERSVRDALGSRKFAGPSARSK